MHGCKYSCTRRDSSQNTLLLSQFPTRANGIIIANPYHFVYHAAIIGFGNKACTNALYLVRTRLTATQNRRIDRFYSHNAHIGIFLFQIFPNSRHRSACSNTSHKNIYFTTRISPNLTPCNLVMTFGVGQILKLLQNNSPSTGHKTKRT